MPLTLRTSPRFALIALAVLAAALAGRLHAAPDAARFEDARLDRLAGRWNVARTIRGEVVRNSLDAEWVLQHRFLRLHYTDPARPPAYEAMVFMGWNRERGEYVVHWIDAFGGDFSETLGHGRAEGDSIVLLFHYPSGDFRNTYRWWPGRGEWTSRGESQDSTGAWRPFMSDRFTRPGR